MAVTRLEEILENINWPTTPSEKDKEEEKFRFIQLEIYGRPYIRFGEASYESHPEILGRVLALSEGKEISLSYSARFKHSPPPSQNEFHKLVGAGYVQVIQNCRGYEKQWRQNIIVLDTPSHTYKISPNNISRD